MCDCAFPYVSIWKPEAYFAVFFHCSLPYFIKQHFSQNFGPATVSKLAGQRALRSFCFCPSALGLYVGTATSRIRLPNFYGDVGDVNSGPYFHVELSPKL